MQPLRHRQERWLLGRSPGRVSAVAHCAAKLTPAAARARACQEAGKL